MKKMVLGLLLAFLFIGCDSEDEKTEQELWLLGFSALTPNSTYDKTSVEFHFFSANNNEKYKTESKTFDGTISDYQALHDEIFDLLKDGKMKLENGTIANSIRSVYVSGTSETYKTVTLPIGKYFIVATYQGRKDGYHWLYSTKYAGIYYEIESTYNPMFLDVVFPCDRNRYGFIKWTKFNDKFDYDFTY
jgi:hypothetical protein